MSEKTDEDRETEGVIVGCVEAPDRINHPAKMHPWIAAFLVSRYAPEGGLVLDPFVGSGTVLWAARHHGRVGIGVDIEQVYVDAASEFGDVHQGDARRLPFASESVDAVVTSPPYGEMIGRAGDRDPKKTAANKARYEQKRFGKVRTDHAVYGSHPDNIGNIPLKRRDGVCFLTEMPKTVLEVKRVLKVGGAAVFVVRDQRLGRKRLGTFDLQGWLVDIAASAGLVFEGRRLFLIPPSSWTLWQRVNEERWGIPIPNVEYALVFRRWK